MGAIARLVPSEDEMEDFVRCLKWLMNRNPEIDCPEPLTAESLPRLRRMIEAQAENLGFDGRYPEGLWPTRIAQTDPALRRAA
jgi:hypothetical protein